MREGDFATWSRAVLAIPWRQGTALSTRELARQLGTDRATLERIARPMAERGLLTTASTDSWQPPTRRPHARERD